MGWRANFQLLASSFTEWSVLRIMTSLIIGRYTGFLMFYFGKCRRMRLRLLVKVNHACYRLVHWAKKPPDLETGR